MMVLLLLSNTAMARWGTPYHTIDQNNFESVVEALSSSPVPDRVVMRAAMWAKYNLVYISDLEQFRLIEYWQSARETFYRRKGDCEDWAALLFYILKTGNVPNVSVWGSWPENSDSGHAYVTAPFKHGWAVLDSSDEVIHTGFPTIWDATGRFWEHFGRKTGEFMRLSLPENSFKIDKPSLFTNSSRLKMHGHLTECEPNQIEMMMPFANSEEEYIKLANKEAIGFLMKANFLKLKGLGFSYSRHGWYSSSREYDDLMYTFHLLFSYIGFNAYWGDFKGLDIDVNPISLNWLKAYVCCRNFGEGWDFKAIVSPLKLIDASMEINDGSLSYGAYLNIMRSETEGNVTIGYSSAKEFIVKVKKGNRTYSISINEYFRLLISWKF